MSATARMRPAAARKRVGPRSALERLLWRKAGQEWMADTALGPHEAFGVYGGFAAANEHSPAPYAPRGRWRSVVVGSPLLRNIRVADDPPRAFPWEGKHCVVTEELSANAEF
jgi:hypothetical protein